MTPMRIPLLLLAALSTALLSGCAGSGGDSAPDEAGSPAGGEDAAETAPALADEDGAAPAAAEARSTVFSKDGMTATGACAYTLVGGTCQWVASDNFLLLEFPGDAQRVTGTLTWTAAGGQAPALALYLIAEEDGAWQWDEDFATEPSGTGEIAFDWDTSGLGNRGLGLAVTSYAGVGALVAWAGASASVQFTLEGAVDSLVAS